LRQNGPNPEIFLADFHKSAIVTLDALTTARASRTLRAAGRLFLASLLVKETQTMNQQTLNTTILSFAFSGMLGSHRREYGAPPPPSATPKKK